MRGTQGVRCAVLGLCLAAAGCLSPARYVAVGPDGGVVAIPRNTNYWPACYRSAAEELMRQKCPGGYVIDHEGEVAVGQSKQEESSGSESSLLFLLLGVGHQTRSSVTHDIAEWRIEFHANGTTPPAQPPAPLATLPPEPERAAPRGAPLP
jgi:hypothetical protein